MKQISLAILIVLSFIVSCSDSEGDKTSQADSAEIQLSGLIKPNSIDTIKIDTFELTDPVSQKTIKEIDELVGKIRNSDSLVQKATKFIQLNENDSLIIVPNFDKQPEEFYASYSILYENDQLIFISESPYSNAGDWWEIDQYFFYENGNIRAFSIHYAGFDDRVEGGIVEEKLVCYFSPNKKLIKRKYQIIDNNDRPIDFRKLEIYPSYYNAGCPKTLLDLYKEKPFLKKDRWLIKDIPDMISNED